MQAIILAAGQGKRLRPYTTNQPKPLTEIHGYPIIEYQLQALNQHKITDITIVIGYQGHLIASYCQARAKYVVNDHYKTTGSLDSLLCCKHIIHEDTLLINADLIFDATLISPIINSPHSTAALIDQQIPLINGEMNVTIRNGLIIAFSKDIPSDQAHAQSLQITKFAYNDIKRVITRGISIQKQMPQAFPAHAYDVIFSESSMYPVHKEQGYWYEIDNTTDLIQCRSNLNAHIK